MIQSQFPPVGFQAEILFGGQPYTTPLYESGFLNCSDEDACQMLAEKDNCGRKNKTAAERYLCKCIPSPPRYSIVHTLRRCCPELSESVYEECCRIIDDNVLTELEYMRCEIRTLVAMRYLYLLCLQTIKDQSDVRNKVECCLSLLEAVTQYVESATKGKNRFFEYLNSVLNYIQSQVDGCECISSNGEIRRIIRGTVNRQRVCAFPVADIFPGFIAKYEPKYKRYDVRTKPHKTMKATEADYSNRPFAPWWTVESCRESVQLDYRIYCRSLDVPEDIRDILIQSDSVRLAGFIIDNLDPRLNKAVENTVPVLSARKGLVSWSARTTLQAEYLCLYRDLISNKQFRICPICKSVFAVEGRGVTRMYCKNHNRNQIDYFNRRRTAKKQGE